MHCYFDNLITIAKCFCKALRILQSNAQVWGAGPSSVFCSSVGVLCSPPKHNTDYLVFYQNRKEREDSQQLHFVLKAKARLPFATACSNYPPALAICGWRGNRREEEGRKKKKPTKNHITADQMGTFHMTKPINHLGGAQVQHSRGATHHFTVYRAQTHGHQSMAPRGPGGALSSLTGPCLMTS